MVSACLAALMLALSPTWAQAAPVDGSTVSTVEVAGQSTTNFSSGLSLTLSHPVTKAEAEKIAAVADRAVTAGEGPAGERLLCNNTYRWSDSNGTFTLQHSCTGTTAPWGFKIAGSLQPFVAGPITETGMTWVRNGVTQPRMAPHVVSDPNYQFHGTFSGSPNGTKIGYDDHFRFRHSIGPGGNADIRIWGTFTLTGDAPCRPGYPC